MIKELLVRDSLCLLMSILVVADTNVTNKQKACNINEQKRQRRTKNMGVGYTIYSQYVKVKTCNERSRIEKNGKKRFRVNCAKAAAKEGGGGVNV